MKFPILAYGTPRKLPKADSLPGRVVVLERGGDVVQRRPEIKRSCVRTALWRTALSWRLQEAQDGAM